MFPCRQDGTDECGVNRVNGASGVGEVGEVLNQPLSNDSPFTERGPIVLKPLRK